MRLISLKHPLSDMKSIMGNHSISSPKAILGQCISEVNENLLVFDFSTFEETTETKNEMDLHTLAVKHEKSDLLLHPLMQIFLELKWNQVKKYYWFNLLIDVAFLICLLFSAYYFLDLTYCQPCNELNESWSMNIDYNGTKGGHRFQKR